jgi:hypothetical protein
MITMGDRVNEFIKINVTRVRFAGLTAEPADAEIGEMWFRSDLNEFHVKVAAGIKVVTVA